MRNQSTSLDIHTSPRLAPLKRSGRGTYTGQRNEAALGLNNLPPSPLPMRKGELGDGQEVVSGTVVKVRKTTG